MKIMKLVANNVFPLYNMAFLLFLDNDEWFSEDKSSNVKYLRGLLFKFVDFLYSRSKTFDTVLKVISSESTRGIQYIMKSLS